MTFKQFFEKNGVRSDLMAKEIGVSPQTIRNYRDNPSNIPLKRCFEMCKLLNIDFVSLALGEVKPLKPNYKITQYR